MAIVKDVTPEQIETLRGKVDFYMLCGILPVARRWPKKPSPPYTDLQATAMKVFSTAAASMKRVKPAIRQAWRVSSVGRRSQWPDSFKAIALKYWKLTRTFPLIGLDYEVIETSTTVAVKWEILEISLISGVEEKITKLETEPVLKEVLNKSVKPVYFTLLDDEGRRQVAPFIKYLDE